MAKYHLLLVTCTLIFSGSITAQTQPPSPPGPVITAGVGAEGIRVGVSTVQDVIAKYGTQYEKIKHEAYSYQLKYPELGMSFYYCQQDPDKKLFTIEYLRGSTSDGIVIGKSTIADVQQRQGLSEDYLTCDGELCLYSYRDDSTHYYTKNKAEDVAPAKQTIVEIDVKPVGFQSCDIDDAK